MPMKYEELQEILRELELGFWISPDRPALVFSSGSRSGRRYLVGGSIDGEGSYLQLRSLEYANCPLTHRNFHAVAVLLLTLNYRYRAVKFSLDPRDGEIACFLDLMLVDAEPTRRQVSALVSFFIDIIDECGPRLRTCIETGEDPGEALTEEAPREAGTEPAGPAPEDVV